MMLAVVARVVQPPLLVVAHTWLERWRGGGPGADEQGGLLPDSDESFVQT